MRDHLGLQKPQFNNRRQPTLRAAGQQALGREAPRPHLKPYLIGFLLFLFHSKLAPFTPLLPPLSLFLSFLLIRDPKTPLTTSGSLEQEESGDMKGPIQPSTYRKISHGLKVLLRGLVLFSIPAQQYSLYTKRTLLRDVTGEAFHFTPSLDCTASQPRIP